MKRSDQQLSWWRRRSNYKWLSAPLVVAVVGVVLSYLLPRIFDDPENDTENAAITQLASDMNTSSATALRASRDIANGHTLKETGDIKKVQRAFNDGLKQWDRNGSDISARLARHNSQLGDEWNEYQEVVVALYQLSSTGIKTARCQHTQHLMNYLLEQPSDQEDLQCFETKQTQEVQKRDCLRAAADPPWDALAACDADNVENYGYKRGNSFMLAYENASKQLLRRGSDLSTRLGG